MCDAFIYATWLIHMCDVTHSYDSYMSHMNALRRTYEWAILHIWMHHTCLMRRIFWLICMSDTCVTHDSHMCHSCKSDMNEHSKWLIYFSTRNDSYMSIRNDSYIPALDITHITHVRHITHEWHMCSTSHMCMSNVTHVNASRHTCKSVISHGNGASHVAYMSHMNESCRTYEWVMLHIRMSHVSHGTHINESCRTYEWVMSQICTRHITHVWVTSDTCVTHANQTWLKYEPYECVTSHIWMSHVAYVICVVHTHVKYARHIHESCSYTSHEWHMCHTRVKGSCRTYARVIWGGCD